MSERQEHAKRHPTKKNTYWCNNCVIWIKPNQQKIMLLDDDETVETSCNGCDTPLYYMVDKPAKVR